MARVAAAVFAGGVVCMFGASAPLPPGDLDAAMAALVPPVDHAGIYG